MMFNIFLDDESVDYMPLNYVIAFKLICIPKSYRHMNEVLMNC